MRVSFDPIKQQKTLHERRLDMHCAHQVFSGHHFTAIDDRFNYGETRHITIGTMSNTLVVVVWTERLNTRRIISLRKTNAREKERYARHINH